MSNTDSTTNKYLPTQAYKGARDFYPDEMLIQNHIFTIWKKVCLSFGFEEYSFPILEPFEIFAAKTGEEIVNQQLFSFTDMGGRKLAIRPELTPGTVRLIAQRYNEIPQPIKWFTIGNNWRYEKPQMGRGREFYQLEANIFGVESVSADLEIMKLMTSIMSAFGANETMYEIKISDRRLITGLLTTLLQLDEETSTKVRRLMDKRKKMEKDDFLKTLYDYGLAKEQADKVEEFMNASLETLGSVISKDILDQNEGYKTIVKLFGLLEDAKLTPYCKFDPSIIRGFDYSDGVVYEVFDKNPQNKRSMFGGERFDKLINIFGNYELAATGFAMGDYTLKEFLQGWNLIPAFENTCEYIVTLWQEDKTGEIFKTAQQVADRIRAAGKSVFMWLEPGTKIDKQLKYADKKGYRYAIIIGENELAKGKIVVKDLRTKTQREISPQELV